MRCCACGSSPSACWGAQVRLGGRGEGPLHLDLPRGGGAPWEQPVALGDVMGEEVEAARARWMVAASARPSASVLPGWTGLCPVGYEQGDTLGFPTLTTEHRGIRLQY